MAFTIRYEQKSMILSVFLFSWLIVSSSSTQPQESAFTQCFTNVTQSPNLLAFSGTSSYKTILLSSVQNQRFLFSQETSKPAIIVSAGDESHVQAAVICARATGLQIRVRSGGHDYEGQSYSTFGGNASFFLTVDISGLRSISFDSGHNSAWVQAGATLGELYYAVAKDHPTKAFPAGICPTVGVGGHVCGGGIGTLTRKFGTAADNVLDARIVDYTGRLLDRSTMGEDLFWAVRGGGSSGFGILVAFKVQLANVPPVVTVFNVGRSLRQNATKLVARWQEVAPKLDVNLFIRVVAQASTEGDRNRTIKVTFNSYYLGRREQLLAEAKQSFPELGLTAADCTEMTWLESTLFFNGEQGKPLEALLDRKPEFNSSFKAKSDFVKNPISETGLEKIWTFLMEAKDEPLVLILEPLGGMMNEIAEDAIAFPHRMGNLYNIQYFMRWFERDEATTQKHLEWMRSLYAFMTPYVSSNPRAAYYNYKDIDLGRNTKGKKTTYSAAKVWGVKYFKDNFRRLALVKAKVDPENFFSNELSVPPIHASEHALN
ncbi:hypothetical protein HPP92_000255 [Vanilla planifolia]|uniref:FAD-binding PCMH-type domain-containing protein n=1 Tax=Vanilla planifolia TaxID=51239 RepID=A0A835VCF3_VANPL|nr:hypothetical protein HPP92_000255 [Vanilla planifolia]